MFRQQAHLDKACMSALKNLFRSLYLESSEGEGQHLGKIIALEFTQGKYKNTNERFSTLWLHGSGKSLLNSWPEGKEDLSFTAL